MAEKPTTKKVKTEESEKSTPVHFVFHGESYRFCDDAPEKIIFGTARSQKALSEDEDALLELVTSNSRLIQKT